MSFGAGGPPPLSSAPSSDSRGNSYREFTPLKVNPGVSSSPNLRLWKNSILKGSKSYVVEGSRLSDLRVRLLCSLAQPLLILQSWLPFG